MPRDLMVGLREPGLSFLPAVWAEYRGWDPASLVLLRQAAEVLDQLADFDAAIAADGPVVPTRAGGHAPHPLLRVQRQARSQLVTLIGALHLEDEK